MNDAKMNWAKINWHQGERAADYTVAKKTALNIGAKMRAILV